MQHLVQHFGQLLRKEWFLGVIVAVNGWNGSRVMRGARRRLREREAVDWPAVEGIARCRAVFTGLGSAVHMRAVPGDGSELAYWSRTFSTSEETKHYAAALDGRTVAIHGNTEKPEERIVCWDELRRMAPAFVPRDGGRMDAAGFRWVRAFQAAVAAAVLLFVTDLGLFATPWGRNVEWHGMCLCELSIGLLLVSGVLLVPARMLRRRVGAVGLDEQGGLLRTVTLWVKIASGGAWAGLLFSMAFNHGEVPDAVFYGLITLPVFPLLWTSGVEVARAEGKLRPTGADSLRETATLTDALVVDHAGVVEANGLR